MKKFILLCFINICLLSIAQTDTEVHLFNLKSVDGVIVPLEGLNVSNNAGYDNQPSFYDDNQLLYVSTRNNQTDIALYTISEKSIKFINDTPNGGEYSPQRIPGSKDISAVRLDNDGKQRLYRYDFETGKSSELIKDLVVAYYTWYDEDTIVSAVIEDNNLNLYVSNLKTKTNTKYAENVGRSFHKIPNSNLVSYISKAEKQWYIKSISPTNGSIQTIRPTLGNSEDITWLNNGSLLLPSKNTIYKFNPEKDKQPSVFAYFEHNDLKDITRIATNTNSTMLTLVSSVSPGTIVQKHIRPFNDRDIDLFGDAFSENVLVSRFNGDTISIGREALKSGYENFYSRNASSHVKVIKRMTHNNWVIDEELATVNGQTTRQITIYQTSNGKIASMTFMGNSPTTSNPERIVDKQLRAYNTRNIEGFLETYSDDIKIYNFPSKKSSSDKETMKTTYGRMFETIPNLNAQIVNRMIIGNKVIDLEKVTVNASIINAIAIYEVKKGLISKVTFIQ